MDSRFDPFLCQAHHLRLIFLLVNDEVLAIRVDALKLLGRLAALNPGYVLPHLRQTLIRLLIELQFGVDSGAKEEATHMLCHFLRYVSDLLMTLLEDDKPIMGCPSLT